MPDLVYAPYFGIYHLNLIEAGHLTVKCLWLRGELNTKITSKESYSLHDLGLQKALAKKALKFTQKLQTAVQTGSLTAEVESRNIDDIIQPETTYVEALTLAEWFEARGVDLGDAFHTDYLAEEATIARSVAEGVAAQRYRHNNKIKLTESELKESAEKIFLSHEVLTLKEKLAAFKAPKKHRAPISEKQRSAYLNIIGALLGLLMGKSPSGKPYSEFQNQQAIIDSVHANFGEAPGLSERNLQDKFALSKRVLRGSTNLP